MRKRTSVPPPHSGAKVGVLNDPLPSHAGPYLCIRKARSLPDRCGVGDTALCPGSVHRPKMSLYFFFLQYFYYLLFSYKSFNVKTKCGMFFIFNLFLNLDILVDSGFEYSMCVCFSVGNDLVSFLFSGYSDTSHLQVRM